MCYVKYYIDYSHLHTLLIGSNTRSIVPISYKELQMDKFRLVARPLSRIGRRWSHEKMAGIPGSSLPFDINNKFVCLFVCLLV